MAQSKNPFSKVKELAKQTTILSSIGTLLEWDQETYMPEEAIEVRSNQVELIASLVHKGRTAPSFKKALENLIDIPSGALKQKDAPLEVQAAAREWREEFLKASKLSASFVKQFAKTTSTALPIWSEAKAKSDFALFAPHLEKIVKLSQKKAKLLGFSDHPYDALLDLYEPKLTVATLTPLFAALKKELIAIYQKAPKPTPLSLGSFPQEKQMEAGRLVLKLMGFSPKESRLDISSHPFCVGVHPIDTRMTTRIDLHNPLSSIASVMHEGGHGLYNTHLPIEFYGTPVCEPASFGVDESQSRLWETMIGKGLPFWKFFYPKLQALFPQNLSHIPLSDFYAYMNRVEPSFIRVEADEVTYCLHIILRFEIEKALIEGSLKVRDIPKVWNAKMQESLSITPSNDAEGCLQDIHWAMGGIGYFPSYALGNLLAAELFSLIQKAHPDWQAKLSSGDLLFCKEWLKDHLHRHGKTYPVKELIPKIIGRPLGIDAYIEYLKRKFN